MGKFIQMCVNTNPASALPLATSDNCHQYFTQTLTAGHDLMQLRKNPNFSALTDHNSVSTIFHSKRWDPEGKFLTLFWLIAVCVAACWVWAIRNRKPFIQIKLILATGLLQNSPLFLLGLFTDLIPLMQLYFVMSKSGWRARDCFREPSRWDCKLFFLHYIFWLWQMHSQCHLKKKKKQDPNLRLRSSHHATSRKQWPF